MRRVRSPSGPARMGLRRFAIRDGPANFQAAGLILCVLLAVGLATRAVTIALVL